MRDTVEEVFYEILDKFKWTPDTEAWALKCKNGEYWASEEEIKASFKNGRYHDDCDGFVELVRSELKRQGVRSRSVYCKLPPDAEGRSLGHLVCLTEDNRILDCRQHVVCYPEDCGYTFISMSDFDDGKTWYSVKRESNNGKE
jgi:predicted transglutaminase-like cysteine proteinase